MQCKVFMGENGIGTKPLPITYIKPYDNDFSLCAFSHLVVVLDSHSCSGNMVNLFQVTK